MTTDRNHRRRTEPGEGVGRSRRRDFVKAVGARALLGADGVDPVSGAAEPTEFVQTDGPNFVLYGEPVYFNGTNNFWIPDSRVTRERA